MGLILKILLQITEIVIIILPLTIIGWFLMPICLLFRLNDTRHRSSPDLKSQRLPKLLKCYDVVYVITYQPDLDTKCCLGYVTSKEEAEKIVQDLTDEGFMYNYNEVTYDYEELEVYKGV